MRISDWSSDVCSSDLRLSKAEVWLKSHPDDSSLLPALGNLCLTGELWGQGEHYLLRSMKIRSDMRIHALLGNLYDRLGRADDASRHWRLASGAAGVLPVRSEEHTSELQSLMRISYAVFCLKKQTKE